MKAIPGNIVLRDPWAIHVWPSCQGPLVVLYRETAAVPWLWRKMECTPWPAWWGEERRATVVRWGQRERRNNVLLCLEKCTGQLCRCGQIYWLDQQDNTRQRRHEFMWLHNSRSTNFRYYRYNSLFCYYYCYNKPYHNYCKTSFCHRLLLYQSHRWEGLIIWKINNFLWIGGK